MAIEATTETSVTPTSSTELLGLDGSNDLKRHNAAKFGIGAPQEWTIWAEFFWPQTTNGAQRSVAYTPAYAETFQAEFAGIRP